MTFSTWWDVLVLNAIVLALAVLLDRLLPEPPSRIHPVVWIGRTVEFLKRPAPRRPAFAFLYGCVIVVAVVGFWSILALIAVTVLKSLGPIAYVAGGAVILRTTFTVKGLSAAAEKTRQTLLEGRLNDARMSLRNLVSRDVTSLPESLVTAATIESVAENTTDSYIAPWLAFAILGVPGAMAYRAINTLDSMLGHRGPLEYLGKASARLDDVVNLVPTRLSALLLLIAGSQFAAAGRPCCETKASPPVPMQD